MMEYKVCFHMSYPLGWTDPNTPKRTRYHGKMHYCGTDLEEAVAKIRRTVAWDFVARGARCTSMWIMRGRDRGKNITWAEYHKEGEAKRLWDKEIAEAENFYNGLNARVEAARQRLIEIGAEMAPLEQERDELVGLIHRYDYPH